MSCTDCIPEGRAKELLAKEQSVGAPGRPISLAERAFILRAREVLVRRGQHQTMTEVVVLEQLAKGERPVRCVVCG